MILVDASVAAELPPGTGTAQRAACGACAAALHAPQNGKEERYIQLLLRTWAYAFRLPSQRPPHAGAPRLAPLE